MQVIPTAIPDVVVLEPEVYGDDRGFFSESYNRNGFNAAIGREVEFVQDNHSRSARNVLRGLHYQIQQAQGKLVRVVTGDVLDVAVDLRRSSPTFGRWVSCRVSADNKRQMWVPEGFAHGFYVLSEFADFLYKTTNYYAPQHERSLLWNDPEVGVVWSEEPIAPVLSRKDREGKPLSVAEVYP
ncbi:dTDP-4-dehydrorhamnose 3,5-epimerase [Rubidibacter lacunae KORDI 51-2]|uniref:dTDP-4-dehydrorhamnose 3,5-epimerase n=1 Tax=Rubidibacter lacunae KORDI 51-2 TaxID=582515 RepID=U5DLK7_9CHRO|nr:dTDP-4-dehydrorhamnose 3,5-epimerase [Rubidibacter lacunae]ERN42556.1 dTDP-4-dehydrorhamnose 3,5-epimerase [Rubidibacter lacunae KORDI 51-2]